MAAVAPIVVSKLLDVVIKMFQEKSSSDKGSSSEKLQELQAQIENLSIPDATSKIELSLDGACLDKLTELSKRQLAVTVDPATVDKFALVASQRGEHIVRLVVDDPLRQALTDERSRSPDGVPMIVAALCAALFFQSCKSIRARVTVAFQHFVLSSHHCDSSNDKLVAGPNRSDERRRRVDVASGRG
jgi:hypothetical protein